MSRNILILILICLTNCFCASEQSDQPTNNYTFNKNSSTTPFEYSFEKSHPNAKAVMAEEFFWNPIEESGPFGSDDGWDAAYGFRQWRSVNPNTSPAIYLRELITSWQYPYFDWHEMDTLKIIAYIESSATINESEIQERIKLMKEVFKNHPSPESDTMDETQMRDVVLAATGEMGGRYLLGQDNAIIGTAFAQFALEGKIEPVVRDLAITALQRQLLPFLVSRYDINYQETRKEQLNKMLAILNNLK